MLDLEQLSDQAQAYFDQFVVSGTDEELFASGYLRGHVDLIIGTAIVNGEPLTLPVVIEQVTNSINNAIKQGELEQQDVDSVNAVLNKLILELQS
ncbi:MAG: YfcL family protein [Gammaproteobacteria bacterium]|nr:YfcL family protein [Gammaproteobacteria bacterium]